MSFWDERFAEPELACGAEPNDWLLECASRIASPVLCLAEEQGRNAVWLAEHGHRVTALDLSSVGLRRAHELAESRGVHIETIHADLADWDGPRGGGAVVAIFAHLHPQIRRRAHRAVASWLRPGGVLVLEAYRPEQLALGTGGPGDAALLYTAVDLAADFEVLEIEHLREAERDVQEGRYHSGRAAVVQVLAHQP